MRYSTGEYSKTFRVFRVCTALILAAALFASASAYAGVPGDVNDDGAFNVTDVQCTVLIILDSTPGDFSDGPYCVSDVVFSDVDCDDNTNVTDILLLVSMVLGSMTGDSGLPEIHDPDADNLHNNCDPFPDFPSAEGGCVDGTSQPHEDGCNTCTCNNNHWLCTKMLCLDTCPDPAAYDGACSQVVVWAKNPESGDCCVYNVPCSAPDGWETFGSEGDCNTANVEPECQAGAETDDGCNTCYCSDSGQWVCTMVYCPDSCVNHADCELGRFCNEQGYCSVCASDTNVVADDGCNTCVCTDDGLLACTAALCPEICASNSDCEDGIDCTDDTCVGCEDAATCGDSGEGLCVHVANGCEPACTEGEEKDHEDGCNTCVCKADGTWNCTKTYCPECESGETMDDDCNECICVGSKWACTDMVCPQCGDGVACSANHICYYGQCVVKPCLNVTECGIGTSCNIDSENCYTPSWCADAQAATGNGGCEADACYGTCGSGPTDSNPCPDANDPNVAYMSTSSATCLILDFACVDGWDYFSNICGCGCEKAIVPEGCLDSSECQFSKYTAPINSVADCYCPMCPTLPLSSAEHASRAASWAVHCTAWENDNACPMPGCMDPGDTMCAKAAGVCETENVMGECVAVQDSCADIYEPVCGCDGKDYGNDCEANSAGVNIDQGGACGSACPDGSQPVQCVVAPCDNAVCLAYPEATCVDNYCGGCNADFYDGANAQVDCTPCEYGGQTYEVGDSFSGVGDDWCNTCTCGDGGVVGCTKIGCPTQCSGDGDCASDEFCAYDPGVCSGQGVCASKPENCTLDVDPVCGCDGNTYSNECDASNAGINIAQYGACGSACADGSQPVQCFVAPCDNAECPANPEATCVDNYCGGCNADFYDKNGALVDCALPTCEYGGQTYQVGDNFSGVGDNWCNSCFCDDGGQVGCTEMFCSAQCSSNGDCASDEYCAYDQGVCSGDGGCTWMPETCTFNYAPVCGCDGKTYSNGCSASSQGINIAKDGECGSGEQDDPGDAE